MQRLGNARLGGRCGGGRRNFAGPSIWSHTHLLTAAPVTSPAEKILKFLAREFAGAAHSATHLQPQALDATMSVFHPKPVVQRETAEGRIMTKCRHPAGLGSRSRCWTNGDMRWYGRVALAEVAQARYRDSRRSYDEVLFLVGFEVVLRSDRVIDVLAISMERKRHGVCFVMNGMNAARLHADELAFVRPEVIFDV